jgi:hypothetical protein
MGPFGYAGDHWQRHDDRLTLEVRLLREVLRQISRAQDGVFWTR